MRLTVALVAAVAALGVGMAGAQYAAKNWDTYHGDRAASHYSELTQVTKENVAQLEKVWTFHSIPGGPGRRSEIQHNPLIVDGVLYGAADDYIFAVDAATGELIWRRDAEDGGDARGLVWWSDGQESRLITAEDDYLVALDPATGKPIESFGDGGRTDMRQGIEGDPDGFRFGLSTPGILYKDLYIMGSGLSESVGAPPGDIQAYNVRSGELAWVFHTIPRPGELGYDTWPEGSWKMQGGANAWAGMSVDVERGMVFVPTGSAVEDFHGATRLGANLFANCIIALNAETGERIWHYQTVRHDLWDKDLPAQANLMTITRNGKKVDVVAQITKQGYVFVLDRDTGEPIFPIEEKPMPKAALDGDEAWPTQPIPTKPPPFVRTYMGPGDVTDISPVANAAAKARLAGLRYEGIYTPVDEKETLIMPGIVGGAEWGGAAHHPTSGMLYVNANELPFTVKMVKMFAGDDLTPYQEGRNAYARFCSSCHGIDRSGGEHMGYTPPLMNLKMRMTKDQLRTIVSEGKGRMEPLPWLTRRPGRFENLAAFLFDEGADEQGEGADSEYIYAHTGHNRFVDAEGYPAIKPPWGTLSAIDLNKGEIVWQVPLGEYEELTARGIAQTGTENWGGPVLTATGLLFIAATADDKIRAFDQDTGKVLWEADLPASGFATPSVYSVNGRQYVVIACGGGKAGKPSSDEYVAFALPESVLKR